MLDSEETTTPTTPSLADDAAPAAPRKRTRAAKKVAGVIAGPDASPVAGADDGTGPTASTTATASEEAPVKAARKSTRAKAVPKKATKTSAGPGDPSVAVADDPSAAAAPAPDEAATDAPALAAPVKAVRRRSTRGAGSAGAAAPIGDSTSPAPAPAPVKSTRRRATRPSAASDQAPAVATLAPAFGFGTTDAPSAAPAPVAVPIGDAAPGIPLFQAPSEPSAASAEVDAPKRATRRRRSTSAARAAEVDPVEIEAADTESADTGAADTGAADTEAADTEAADTGAADTEAADTEAEDGSDAADSEDGGTGEGEATRRRRRRGRRGRGSRIENDTAPGESTDSEPTDAVGRFDPEASVDPEASADSGASADSEDDDGATDPAGSRRRRRRRRGADSADAGADDAPSAPTRARTPRAPRNESRSDGGRAEANDEVKGIRGSSRLEAKRQRRRDGRETSRRRPPILSEAEFLARRESVDRVMAVRQQGDRTQIAILEDDILVEHYVTRASATSYVGNVYLGRVQNVLPSMEAAFVDIGKGRNGVLYAGEVNWDAAGLEGKARAIEAAMKSGDALLVQVTKDPIGHKGARLTSQISLPGRFLVYVPGGGMTGISRRLPDTERHRLKAILKKVVPDEAGVIVRTAAEGATEEDLIADVERLQSQWAAIQAKAAKPGDAPLLLHGEPDLAIRVVRDVFNEDFQSMVVDGEQTWSEVSDYISSVAPELGERVAKYTGTGELFHDLRVDEQLAKALDRKVWLPSGGSLVIDRTEAMVVIDVNTGKFTGSGGNLESTVTKNNLEAAEEIVRQLRLRDVGGIIVIDFIDMVLESNRDLVLRRLTECLGRDRTKHQVAEVTSLGLVQMTRKRVGEGLLEAFSEPCEVCKGRGVIVHSEPVAHRVENGGSPSGNSNSGNSNSGNANSGGDGPSNRRGRRPKGQPVDDERSAAEVAEAAEQRRAAAEAMAAIARRSELTNAHPDDIAPDDIAPDDIAPDGEEEVDVVELAESGDVPDVVADLEAFADDTDATATEDHDPVGDEPAPPAPAAAGRPRRRRAASRPAGPPQPVGVGA